MGEKLRALWEASRQTKTDFAKQSGISRTALERAFGLESFSPLLLKKLLKAGIDFGIAPPSVNIDELMKCKERVKELEYIISLQRDLLESRKK